MAAGEAGAEDPTPDRTEAPLPAAFADPWTAAQLRIRMRQSEALVLRVVQAARPPAASESLEEESMTRESTTGESMADHQDQETGTAPRRAAEACEVAEPIEPIQVA